MHAFNRRTVFSVVRAAAASAKLLVEHVPAATDMNAKIEGYFLCGPCRDANRGKVTVSQSEALYILYINHFQLYIIFLSFRYVCTY
jgi:hypothetical protein